MGHGKRDAAHAAYLVVLVIGLLLIVFVPWFGLIVPRCRT